jgi:alanine-synthesizing transaminase
MTSSAAIEFARLKRLPPYVFNITSELKMAARRRGEDIIDFGMGNPTADAAAHRRHRDRTALASARGHPAPASRDLPAVSPAVSNSIRRPRPSSPSAEGRH